MFKTFKILFLLNFQVLFAFNIFQPELERPNTDEISTNKFKFYCNKEFTESYYAKNGTWVTYLNKISSLGRKIPNHVRSIEIKTDVQDPENLKKINFNKVDSLILSYMSSNIHPEFQLKNLVGSKFPHLKFLSVHNSSLKDISPLKKIYLPALEKLHFQKNPIQDISVLKKLFFPKLRSLSFHGCDITDITPLLSFKAPLLETICFFRNEELCISLEHAKKLKKQFPLLKKIGILRTACKGNFSHIFFQKNGIFMQREQKHVHDCYQKI
ncbi:leucine Rich repeats (2 copies) [Holospora obtusa F1]|uniref:Leucine Rich repeats (2 copies) n=1 Tax=Holospora obtusa F1 TaxID=1399147 RepID=W6TEU8_HOLOB|nr:leucine-rich repeat domain-containing protein [Holospora obtusa]ETZ07409.1 leucine Rich repeats (2 copies) [Holospora obtusa F1]